MPTPQNGQIHSKNSSATADELFEFVRPFCGVWCPLIDIWLENIQILDRLFDMALDFGAGCMGGEFWYHLSEIFKNNLW